MFEEIKTNPLGLTKIRTIKGWFILDDTSILGYTMAERRLKIKTAGAELYPLYERVDMLRQLCKYKTGTNFVNAIGKVFSYKKSSGLNKIQSCKIISAFTPPEGQTVFYCEEVPQPFITTLNLEDINYASLMDTKNGIFLYDLTTEKHELYRRKI